MNITVTAKPKSEHVADLKAQLNRISEMLGDDITMDTVNDIGECLDELEGNLQKRAGALNHLFPS